MAKVVSLKKNEKGKKKKMRGQKKRQKIPTVELATLQ